MKKLFTLLSITFLIIFNSYGQSRVVNGNVYAFKDLKLKNIIVTAKKSGAAVLTDSLGNFSIACEPKDKLVFTGKGFRKMVYSVNKKDRLSVKMVMLEGSKNEDIAVGYGHIDRHEMNYAISHYSSYNNDYATYTDIFELLRGKFAGVEVVGNGNSKHVIVRGISSSGNNYAIYVVNGIVMYDISHIEPINVKSVDVIKDGNAFYGSQGANGVVVITTLDQAEGMRSGR